jgi:hypothetical protein
MVSTTLTVVALVLLLLQALSVKTLARLQEGWLGLAAYVAAGLWVALKFPGG